MEWQTFVTSVLDVIEKMTVEWQAVVADALNIAWRFRYITTDTADGIVALIVVAAFLILVGVFIGPRFLKPAQVIAVSLMVPVVFVAFILVRDAALGVPHERCEKLEGGELTFVIEKLHVIPMDPAFPYDPNKKWIVLIARAPERWGTALNICQWPIQSPVGKIIRKQILEQGRRVIEGVTTLRFGPHPEERVNLEWVPKNPPPSFRKPGPPEVPSDTNKQSL